MATSEKLGVHIVKEKCPIKAIIWLYDARTRSLARSRINKHHDEWVIGQSNNNWFFFFFIIIIIITRFFFIHHSHSYSRLSWRAARASVWPCKKCRAERFHSCVCVCVCVFDGEFPYFRFFKNLISSKIGFTCRLIFILQLNGIFFSTQLATRILISCCPSNCPEIHVAQWHTHIHTIDCKTESLMKWNYFQKNCGISSSVCTTSTF